MDAAKFSEKFATSIVFGNDIVARISLPSIEGLRQRVIDIMYHCQTPKVNCCNISLFENAYDETCSINY